MSRIKGRDTQPEILVRSMIFRMGFRFRLHRTDLPGTPDIVLPRLKKIIFVHGCFWHGHKGCPRSKRPMTNVDFWHKKLDSNMERDKRVCKELREKGWDILVVWGCETKDSEQLRKKLERFLRNADE